MSTEAGFESFSVSQDAFDSAMLGGPVFRLKLSHDESNLPADLRSVLEAADGVDARLIVARVPSGSFYEETFSRAGFTKVEELVVYERALGDESPQPTVLVETARASDARACVALAGREFSFDRYHADPLVSDELADAVKEAWVKNSFSGRADRLLVARLGGDIKGFVSCLKKPDHATIDLIAVDASVRGRGIGRSLLSSAMGLYAESMPVIRAGTQADNLASTNLYESCGFYRVERWQTFHAHPTGAVT